MEEWKKRRDQVERDLKEVKDNYLHIDTRRKIVVLSQRAMAGRNQQGQLTYLRQNNAGHLSPDAWIRLTN